MPATTLKTTWIPLLAATLAGALAYKTGFTWHANILLATLGTLLLARFIYKLGKGKYTVDIIMGGVSWILALAGKPLEGLLILAVYAIAEIMEEGAETLASTRLSRLLKLLPDKATIQEDGQVRQVPIDHVEPGQTILVGRGQVIPVDGVLLDNATLDTSLLTGEHSPLDAEPGTPVYSGYINLGDPVRVKATRKPGESSLQKLVTTALRLLERKTLIETAIERVTPAYTIVLFTAAAAMLYFTGLNAAVSILVAGCPSALLLTASTLSMTTVAAASRMGMVVKGGRALEKLAMTRVVLLDKTGTLTLGKPSVAMVNPPPGYSVEETLQAAAALATASSHPLSRGILEAAREKGISVPEPQRVEEKPGQGLIGWVDGAEVRLGSQELVAGARDRLPQCPEGTIPVYISIRGAIGSICLEDRLDDNAFETVKALKAKGYRIVIASGDKPGNVERAASALGINEWYAGLRPEDKKKLVYRLRSETGPVTVVGDGINDIVAMAAADASVAVGEIDVTVDVADAVLREPGIGGLPALLEAAKGFRRGLIAGFAVAGTIKATAIILGTLSVIPLWVVALIGDDGSTIAAITTGTIASMPALKRPGPPVR